MSDNAHLPPETAELLIRTELEKAASLITGARRLMTEGRSIDLSAVEERVRAVTEAIAAAPPATAATFKEHLSVLVEILDTLQTDMEVQHQALADGIKTIKHREAAGAYTPPLGSPADVTPPEKPPEDEDA